MKHTGQLLETVEQLSGNENHEIDGNCIALSWKVFQATERSQEISQSNSVVIFIPGWTISDQAKSIELLGQTLANYSEETAYAVETRADEVIPYSTQVGAEAIRRFIEERDITNLTLVGNSLGGVEAIHLTALLQERNPNITIDGLILFDSMSLYDQTFPDLALTEIKDVINTRSGLNHPPHMKGGNVLADQNRMYLRDVIRETLKETVHSNIHYIKRIMNEIEQMIERNPHLGTIKTPVVIVQGAYDLLSDPAKIIPTQESEVATDAQYIMDMHERERFLREHVFTSSPYVKMIVPEKMGYHNVSYSRPESVARASLYLLKRWHRQKTQRIVTQR